MREPAVSAVGAEVGATEGSAAADSPMDSPMDAIGRPVWVRVVALTLDNFKSFAKKTRIPIRPGFTTVSGPNGSGKSNLIDAMQFVLGIATSKGMRAERLTDLICIEGNKTTARVSLELEGEFEPPAGATEGATGTVRRRLEVSRVVRRVKQGGAQAHYELDGKPVRLTDLHDLMRELGFPTSGQNIVLQGDVIRLTSMGGVARRQVLDELAGTREFDRRIEAAHEELGASERLTDDTRLILAELQARVGQLKLERDQALAHRSLTGRKQDAEGELVCLDVTEAEVALAARVHEAHEAEKAQKQLARRREQLDREAAAANKALAAVEAELEAKGDGERLAQVRQVEQLRARAEGARERARAARAEEAALAARAPQLARAVEEGEARLEALGQAADERGATLDEREAKHQALTRRFEGIAASLRKQGADQIRQVEQAREIQGEVDRLRAREGELQARDRELAERLGRGEAERGLLEGGHGEAARRHGALSEEVAEAAARLRARREAVKEAEERRRTAAQQTGHLRSGLDAVAGKLSKAEQELAAAEARRAQAFELGGGRALAALKELRGVHGTVADLIRFEGRYALALDAAAGGSLGWVVVDDERVAQAGIELLRRTGAGRLTFAPLTKVRGRRPDGAAPRGRAIVGWANELVEHDRRYDEVISSILGTTLVVETTQDALPLIGRHRMVTLDGDLHDLRGTMTGGAATRGGRLLVQAAQAQEEIDQRRRAIEELERQRSAARGALVRAEAELGQAQDALAREQKALAEVEAQVSSLTGELRRLEEQLGPQGKRLQALAGELEAACREQAELTGALERVRGDLAAAAARLAAIDHPEHGAQFDELNRQAQECEQQMRALEQELARLRGGHAEALAERRGAEERLEAARASLAQATAQRAEQARRGALAEAEAEEVTAELADREAALAALSAELKALAERREAARQAAQATRDAARAAQTELEALAARLAQLAVDTAAAREKAAALRAHATSLGLEAPGVEDAPADLPRARRKLEQALAKLEHELEALGPVNQLAVEQYDQVIERTGELETKLAALDVERDQLRARIVDLEGKKRTAFLDAFERVSEAFQSAFAELARGEGRLRLEAPEDPFAGGLIIEARPRGKKLARLEAMSGGEKSLTALAFIFALQEVNPAPFFVFDEVDQSLDGVNTEVLAEAIRARARTRQYVVISHHRVMLDRSSQTLGVSMRKGWGTVVTGVAMDGAEGGPDGGAGGGAGGGAEVAGQAAGGAAGGAR